MRAIRVLVIAVTTLAVAARSGAGQLPAPSADTVLVTASWLNGRLAQPDLVLLHVGQRSDYDSGHIPGARYVAPNAYVAQPQPGAAEPTLRTELPTLAVLDSVLESLGVSNGSRIVIYGSSVTSVARLYVTLEYVGLGARTSILDGGLAAWREAGRPVVTEAPVVAQGALTLVPRSNVIADLAAVRSAARLDAAGAAVAGGSPPTPWIVDARTPEFYTGASAGSMPRAGHIPGAVNVPFSSLVQQGTLFRPAAEIQKLFDDAGVQPGSAVITYCHIGLQASVAYVAAKVAGLRPRMYDGSFDEWSRTPTLPIARK